MTYGRYFSGRGEHWREVEEEDNQYRGKVNDLRWGVYIKYKEELIKREFLVAVLHSNWGGGSFGLL